MIIGPNGPQVFKWLTPSLAFDASAFAREPARTPQSLPSVASSADYRIRHEGRGTGR
jgi:hypothetical protein